LEDNWRREIFKLLFGFIAGGRVFHSHRTSAFKGGSVSGEANTQIARYPPEVADCDDKKWLYQREEYGLAAASAVGGWTQPEK
jgi:hypothetical protein